MSIYETLWLTKLSDHSVRCPVGLPDKTQGVIFSPVPVEIAYFDPERVGMSLLNQTVGKDDNTTLIMSDLERFENVLEDMEEAVDRLLVYVKKVIVSCLCIYGVIKLCVLFRMEQFQLIVK